MPFNANLLPEPQNEYVAWVDVMGIQSAMSRSLSISANFVFKLHIAALSAPRENVQIYPVMDGFYACSPCQNAMLAFLRNVLTTMGSIFLETPQPLHRFIARGALAFGPVIHGSQVPDGVDPGLVGHEQYKSAILLGMPIVQANKAEGFAPPFGIYIHESARAFAPDGQQPFHHVWWKWVNPDVSHVWNNLLERLSSHYEWCSGRPNRLLYDATRISAHKQLATEYFSAD
ncbi:TPA: hypothetical protein P2N00_001605 [Aeromonas salmonicida]|uniref:Uncharacterized protein n=1 Tax=Aeromonas salmonicida (strain A449) TaxID=382245 RepID=A4SLA7_AERS4|nr:hypothetical protein [Aeromonas salmonicida]ABO89679.1 hypothetical protein ASA_1594 [Aeromonas salmonicida subsp. salmonicida A449]EKP0241520.1 hypothetical protein [Aeromonas salmonicida]EKP0245621.1 hypothetical protein [Aeromonas salmonicida]EKP0254215.1 hypothetical protein [Aeromonas salmonicida]EKP0258103.1 hypothetical protein [Aeromonas salmonicida]